MDYQIAPTIKEEFPLDYALVNADYHWSNILFSVSNKWGNFEVKGDVKWLSLLKLVDGKKTGWALLENWYKEESNVDELSFIRLLGKLRRLSILNFRSAPN